MVPTVPQSVMVDGGYLDWILVDGYCDVDGLMFDALPVFTQLDRRHDTLTMKQC